MNIRKLLKWEGICFCFFASLVNISLLRSCFWDGPPTPLGEVSRNIPKTAAKHTSEIKATAGFY